MSLPITKEQAHAVARWMKSNFGAAIAGSVKGTPFSVDVLCGIACQETAYFWLNFLNTLSKDQILARCVLDASGDFPGTRRGVFPRNTDAFRKRYGAEFTNMLIKEANDTRDLRGYPPKNWVYKGYGIYQYDLQWVTDDEAFFHERKWYNFDDCLDCVLKELREKYKVYPDLWKAIRAYNGSGAAATAYANNVIQFTAYCAEVQV
jgi:hypothetical protein